MSGRADKAPGLQENIQVIIVDEPLQLSIVVPVKDEEGNLTPLLDEIRTALAPSAVAYEVILVDDGSADGSLPEMRALAEADSHVRYLSFAANCGQSAAFKAGFDEARGEAVATMDADLQNDPADIPAMLELYRQGFDMVIGWRSARRDSWLKRAGSLVGNSVRNAVTRENVRDTGCSLKIMRADMVRRLPMFVGMHRFLPTLMKMQGARVAEVAVNHRPRCRGASKYTNWQRALVGLSDVLAVRWMQRRTRIPTIRERGPDTGHP